MDPIHLNEEELEYELKIRRIEVAGTPRHQTLALRKILNCEANGTTSEPKSSSGCYETDSEIKICEEKIVELIKLKTKANEENDQYMRNELFNSRLERVESVQHSEEHKVLSSLLAQVVQERLDLSASRTEDSHPITPQIKTSKRTVAKEVAGTSTGEAGLGSQLPQTSQQTHDTPGYIWQNWMPSPYGLEPRFRPSCFVDKPREDHNTWQGNGATPKSRPNETAKRYGYKEDVIHRREKD